jgi:hypothetical protein
MLAITAPGAQPSIEPALTHSSRSLGTHELAISTLCSHSVGEHSPTARSPFRSFSRSESNGRPSFRPVLPYLNFVRRAPAPILTSHAQRCARTLGFEGNRLLGRVLTAACP